MIIVRHRINTLAELKDIPSRFGVEIDVRNIGQKLILNHDPWENGDSLEDFLINYNHKLLILNVKTEGIEEEVIRLLNKYNIKEYFFLDVSFPYIVKLSNKGLRKNAVRFSEYESLQTCLAMKGKCEWIWVDCFSEMPLTLDAYHQLKEYFKICLVSPDLLGRPDEIREYKKLVKEMNLDAVCTKNWREWQ